MGQNRLKLNAYNIQLIWLGTREQLAKLTIEQLKLALVQEFIHCRLDYYTFSRDWCNQRSL